MESSSLCTSGIKLYKRIQAADTNHFFGYKSFRIFNTDHLTQHLGPPDNRIQEFGSGNISLGFILIISCGMKLGTVSPDRFQFSFKNRCDIVYKTGLVKSVLDKMKNIFGPPMFLFLSLLVVG